MQAVVAAATGEPVIGGEAPDRFVAVGRRVQQHTRTQVGQGPDRAVGKLHPLDAGGGVAQAVAQHDAVTGGEGQHQVHAGRRAAPHRDQVGDVEVRQRQLVGQRIAVVLDAVVAVAAAEDKLVVAVATVEHVGPGATAEQVGRTGANDEVGIRRAGVEDQSRDDFGQRQRRRHRTGRAGCCSVDEAEQLDRVRRAAGQAVDDGHRIVAAGEADQQVVRCRLDAHKTRLVSRVAAQLDDIAVVAAVVVDDIAAVATTQDIGIAAVAAPQHIPAFAAEQLVVEAAAGDDIVEHGRRCGNRQRGQVGLGPDRAVVKNDALEAALEIRREGLFQHDARGVTRSGCRFGDEQHEVVALALAQHRIDHRHAVQQQGVEATEGAAVLEQVITVTTSPDDAVVTTGADDMVGAGTAFDDIGGAESGDRRR